MIQIHLNILEYLNFVKYFEASASFFLVSFIAQLCCANVATNSAVSLFEQVTRTHLQMQMTCLAFQMHSHAELQKNVNPN